MLVFRLYHLGNDRVFNRKRDSYGAEFWLAIPAEGFGDVVARNSTRYGTHGFVG